MSGFFAKLFAPAPKIAQVYTVPGVLTGKFDVNRDAIFGEVHDQVAIKPCQINIRVMRKGKILLEHPAERVGQHYHYRFNFPTQGLIDRAELISEVVTVQAHIHHGSYSTLQLDGATGLELVREFMGVPSETICELNFIGGGSAYDFIGKGWSSPGQSDYNWTENDDSYITLPSLITQPGNFAFRLITGAMVKPPIINGQTVALFVNSEQIWDEYMRYSHAQYFDIKFQGDPFVGQPLELRLHHPNAIRPSELSDSKDTRRLALSVKKLTLVRFL